jgi:RNA polymerase sigma-70 factor (ECF subfamily)
MHRPGREPSPIARAATTGPAQPAGDRMPADPETATGRADPGAASVPAHPERTIARPEPPEASLVERARSGDAAAYEALVRRHQEVAFRAAWLVTRSAPDAEDVAQEAFLKAYRALGSFKPGMPFRPWLLRIVTNEARNRVRWRSRHPLGPPSAAGPEDRDDPPGFAHEPIDPAPSPEDQAITAEQRELLLAALRRLGDDDRLVIGHRYFLDLSEAESADALGVPRGTVKSRLSRAMGRLRAQLEGVG